MVSTSRHVTTLFKSISLSILLIATTISMGNGNDEECVAQPNNAPGVEVVDNSRHGLPLVRMGERVIDLMSGINFDNLMQDTPDELRPPSLIMFHGFETCPDADTQLQFRVTSETNLPSRERLLIATYDMDANPVRAWYKFTPEMDLAKRFGVDPSKDCPSLVFVPRGPDCDGFTEWCVEKTDDPLIDKVGCESFKDKCGPRVKKWDGKGNWVDWVKRLIKMEGEPEISPVLGSYTDQHRWLRQRDGTTNENQLRNYFLAQGVPAFTKTGYLVMPTPPELKEFFLDLWNKKKGKRRMESYRSGSTNLGFHDVPTSFVPLDNENKLANEIIKPIMEKWSGLKPLELTSFYGIREYKNQSWLRNHVDRINTHVLSVTFVVAKTNSSDPDQILSPEDVSKMPKWPLEVFGYDGQIYRHEHPPDYMILYESTKLIHGRPYKNAGPDHLGAFCHFKPLKMETLVNQNWENIATAAGKYLEQHVLRGTYQSTAIVEPTMPVFSKHRYAEGTGFKSQSMASGKSPTTQLNTNNGKRSSFTIKLINESDRALDLAWINSSGGFIKKGTVASQATLQVNTFPGHKFVWLEKDTSIPVPQGHFQIEEEPRIYKYQTRLEGF